MRFEESKLFWLQKWNTSALMIRESKFTKTEMIEFFETHNTLEWFLKEV